MKKSPHAEKTHSHLRLTLKPVLAALLVVSMPVLYAAGPEVPGAGTILQQIKPVVPPTPSAVAPGLRIESDNGAALPPSAPFMVKTIRISGNTLFDTATLHALMADAEGKNFTLAQLGEQAARITDYYHRQGYPLTRAVIPAQTIHEGVVEIRVIEARYSVIALDNHSLVNDTLLQSTLSPLQSGKSIDQASLDHSLLLLSDIPGVTVDATLKPGEAVATSDLLVEAGAGPSITGVVSVDDYGNRNTGRARIGGTVNIIDPLHHGDVLSVSGLSSGSGINYGRLAYDTLLNGLGTRMGGSYSALRYALGQSLASLNAHGTAQVESLWVKHPFVRSRDVNLYGQIQYDQMQLRDDIDASAIRTERHLGTWSVGLVGDARDTLLFGAVSTWSVGLTAGRVGFDNIAAQLADAATAKTQGHFSKENVTLARLQNFSPKDALYLSFAGQWANTNLDPSQKMTVGGAYTVRAYDMGVISGDTGYLGTAELRHDLGSFWGGKWQAVAFIDSAHVTINQSTWVAGANSATLSGVGMGLNWAGPNQWSAKTYLAARVGSTPVLVGSTASARLWVEVSKSF